MKYFDTFTGIGAGTLAIQSIFPNAECVGFSEIDKYCEAVYKYHYPNHINYGDISLIDIDKLPDFDLLIGGSPCQDLSVAKKDRQGLDGSRSSLFFKYVEIRNIKKPKYFILENVASMRSADKDKMSEILGFQPVMINSALVSAQSRKRLFWVSSRQDICKNCNYEQLLKKIQHRGETTKTQTTSFGELPQKESTEAYPMQNLRKAIFSCRFNDQMLLKRLYDNQQEAKRQEEQETAFSTSVPKEILQSKQDKIARIWHSLSEEQQREISGILQNLRCKTNCTNEKGTERSVEEEQQDHQYDWERGIVGYVEKDKYGMYFLRFFEGHNSRSYNSSEQRWNQPFRELTTPMSQLQFIQKGQANICSCCGAIMPMKYEKVEVRQPEDKGILLKDILEDEVDSKYFVNINDNFKLKGLCDQNGKSKTLLASCYKGYGNDGTTIVKTKDVFSYDYYNNKIVPNNKAKTLGTNPQSTTAVAGQLIIQPIRIGDIGSNAQAHRVYIPEGKSVNLTSGGGGQGAKTGLYIVPTRIGQINSGGQGNRVYSEEGKSITLASNSGGLGSNTGLYLLNDKSMDNYHIRKLSPNECCKLQTFPIDYNKYGLFINKFNELEKRDISDTQRFKQLGNSFTVDVIRHILLFID